MQPAEPQQPEQTAQSEPEEQQEQSESVARHRRGEMPKQTFPWDKHDGDHTGNESGGQHRQEEN